jgi:hypothetical protein
LLRKVIEPAAVVRVVGVDRDLVAVDRAVLAAVEAAADRVGLAEPAVEAACGKQERPLAAVELEREQVVAVAVVLAEPAQAAVEEPVAVVAPAVAVELVVGRVEAGVVVQPDRASLGSG